MSKRRNITANRRNKRRFSKKIYGGNPLYRQYPQQNKSYERYNPSVIPNNSQLLRRDIPQTTIPRANPQYDFSGIQSNTRYEQLTPSRPLPIPISSPPTPVELKNQNKPKGFRGYFNRLFTRKNKKKSINEPLLTNTQATPIPKKPSRWNRFLASVSSPFKRRNRTGGYKTKKGRYNNRRRKSNKKKNRKGGSNRTPKNTPTKQAINPALNPIGAADNFANIAHNNAVAANGNATNAANAANAAHTAHTDAVNIANAAAANDEVNIAVNIALMAANIAANAANTAVNAAANADIADQTAANAAAANNITNAHAAANAAANAAQIAAQAAIHAANAAQAAQTAADFVQAATNASSDSNYSSNSDSNNTNNGPDLPNGPSPMNLTDQFNNAAPPNLGLY